MPIYRQLSSVSDNNALKAFVFGSIESAGYTVVTDRSSQENYKVYELPSSIGNRYLKVTCSFGMYIPDIYLSLYYFWNPSTRTGIAETSFSQSFSTLPLMALCNSSFILFTSSASSDPEFIGMFRMDFPYNPSFTVTQNVSSGSNRTIYLNSTQGIVPNSYWVASTNSSTGRVVIKPSSVSSNSITVNNLPISLSQGNKIVKFPDLFCLISNYSSAVCSHYLYADSSLNLSATSTWSSSLSFNYCYYQTSYVDFPLLFPLVADFNGFPFRISEDYFYISPQYSSSLPTSNSILVYDTVSSGTVSSATSTTLTDTSKNWASGSLAGKYAVIQSSKDCRLITGNTSNTITVNEQWFSTPPSGTSYVICSDAFFVRVPALFSGMYSFFPIFSLTKD